MAQNIKNTGKFSGAYPQKQENMFMQRVKILGGRIGWEQWRTMVELAGKYSPATPLHITTRQDIEFHNVPVDKLENLKSELEGLGFDTFGAGGDGVRNITVCPGCKDKNAVDLFPLAEQLQSYFNSQPFESALPRKFKISLSGCSDKCARPFISCLGFVAQPNKLFTVIGAGSLGAVPGLGIELYRDLPAEDIFALCTAAVELFIEFGDRENRRKARFRHIRTRLGDEAFIKELNKRFEKQKALKNGSKVEIAAIDTDAKFITRLQLINGNISIEDALLLAEVAEEGSAELRINLTHGLELYGPKPVKLPGRLARLEGLPRIVACPGAATCPNGIVECHKTSERIAELFADKPGCEATIAISGCANGCAHSRVADVGLVGRLKTVDGKQTTCFQSYINGGNGKNDVLAQKDEVVAEVDVCKFVTPFRVIRS
jgi:sulfite reductase (ferredoxin)